MKKTMKSLLALALALCLLLGCVAMAEEIDVGDVDGTDNSSRFALRIIATEGDSYCYVNNDEEAEYQVNDTPITINAGDVKEDTTTIHGEANAIYVNVYDGGSATVNAKDVTAISSNLESSNGVTFFGDGDTLNINVEDIHAQSEWDASGIVTEARDGEGFGGKATINAGTVTATAEGEERSGATGLGIITLEGGEISVKTGDVKASAGYDPYGVTVHNDMNATIDIMVDGNVEALANADDPNAGGTGIWQLNNYGEVKISVTGDVTATGKRGVGIDIDPYDQSNGTTDILVGGTVSGEETAIKWSTQAGSTNLYLWKVEENEEGQLAKVMTQDENGKYVVDTAASTAAEQAINYIVKVADSFKSSVTAKGTGTYTADGTTYDLAHQDEKVTVSYKINEAEEGFDGFYYDGDAKTEAKTDEWGKNDDGSFWVKMLRSGGMLLGLKTHKHEKATREENKVAATCTKEGSYDLVTYCSVCNKVLSTEKKTVAALGHTSGAAVKEKEVAPTCTKAGSYDEVVYCTVCKAEVSRKTVAVDKLAHTPGAAVKEKEVAPTCTKAGSYDEVVYCTVCKAEVSRTTKTVAALGHTPAATVKENQKAAKPGVKGTYDEVVYCSVCGEELSREHKETPALAVAEAEPAVKTELVYEAVEALNGVKVADHPEVAEALAAVGEALDGENVTVTIPGAEKLMDAEEMKTFNKLPVKDRLLVVLSALGFANDTLGDATADMSDDAKALSETVAERMENLPEAEKQALLKAIGEAFPKGTVTVDGKACESFSIDLVIEKSGNKRYERYTFYDDEGTWKLFGIEQGEYKEIEA